MSWAVNHSPRLTMYSGERLSMTEENSSNFSAMGYLRPSSSAISTKRSSIWERRGRASTWYWMWALASRSRSVTLLSSFSRLPAAETTT